MKKILFILLVAFNYSYGQNNGITYQAVLYNPNGEELPGFDNMYAALVDKDVCLRFSIMDSSNALEYQEQIRVKTDVFGMVNVIIGNSNQIGGYALGFNDIVWNESPKSLKVDLDINGSCNEFQEISNQPFTYVPFAYYAANMDDPEPGPQGEPGLSAYEIWLNEGNTGTEQEFLDSLMGNQGENGLNTLQIADIENPGSNCVNGGVKIQMGLDINNDGVLQETEINPSQTQYICNGADSSFQDGVNIGDILYWDGTKWELLPIGLNGQTLTACNGILQWGPCVNPSTNGSGVITSINSCTIASTGTMSEGLSVSGVTQTINVTVGVIGSYDLQASANGVTFSASGNFTSTGAQDIILIATGTPTTAGINSFSLNTTPNCSFNFNTDPLVMIDIDGNIYDGVVICDQVWSQSNLNVSRYRNGDVIPQITNATEWANATTGAWRYFQDNTANGPIYGKMYNWLAVNDPRGLAPEGWHVPSHSEWTILTDCLGGIDIAGGKMKEAGYTHWSAPNTGATNSSGFTGLPGGDLNYFGNFDAPIDQVGSWWSSTETGTYAYQRNLQYNKINVTSSGIGKLSGIFVRCIKD